MNIFDPKNRRTQSFDQFCKQAEQLQREKPKTETGSAEITNKTLQGTVKGEAGYTGALTEPKTESGEAAITKKTLQGTVVGEKGYNKTLSENEKMGDNLIMNLINIGQGMKHLQLFENFSEEKTYWIQRVLHDYNGKHEHVTKSYYLGRGATPKWVSGSDESKDDRATFTKEEGDKLISTLPKLGTVFAGPHTKPYVQGYGLIQTN